MPNNRLHFNLFQYLTQLRSNVYSFIEIMLIPPKPMNLQNQTQESVGPKKVFACVNSVSLESIILVGPLWIILSFCQCYQKAFLMWPYVLFTNHKKNKKKREAPSIHDPTSLWLNGNSIPEIGCHYCRPRLIALHKNTLPVYQPETISHHYDKSSSKIEWKNQLDMLQ